MKCEVTQNIQFIFSYNLYIWSHSYIWKLIVCLVSVGHLLLQDTAEQTVSWDVGDNKKIKSDLCLQLQFTTRSPMRLISCFRLSQVNKKHFRLWFCQSAKKTHIRHTTLCVMQDVRHRPHVKNLVFSESQTGNWNLPASLELAVNKRPQLITGAQQGLWRMPCFHNKSLAGLLN